MKVIKLILLLTLLSSMVLASSERMALRELSHGRRLGLIKRYRNWRNKRKEEKARKEAEEKAKKEAKEKAMKEAEENHLSWVEAREKYDSCYKDCMSSSNNKKACEDSCHHIIAPFVDQYN